VTVTFEAPDAVRWIARTLESSGYDTWAVGGAVRDALAGRPSGDWDMTTRATPAQVRKLFRRTVPIRMDHGTVGVLAPDGTMYEVTTFRRDVETTGRHAVVAFAETLDEDLARRDFTINAIAWHPLTGRTHDPFGGASDLDQGLLRTVGRAEDRFAEDHLRVLRALRFAGVFRLAIEGETWRALTRAVPSTRLLSAERLREELDKVLALQTPPSRVLALYVASGAMAFLYPEIDRLVEVSRALGDPVFRRVPPDLEKRRADGRGWFAHGLRTVDALPPIRPELRWVAMLLGLGVPADAPTEDDAPAGALPAVLAPPAAAPGQDLRKRAALRSAALLIRLRSSNARVRDVSELVQWVSDPPDSGWSEVRLRRWVAAVGRGRVPALLRVWTSAVRADEAAGGPWTRADLLNCWSRARRILRSGAALALEELAFDGRELIRMGYAPGPHFGEVLSHLLDAVLEDPTRNDSEWLAGEAGRWLGSRDIHPRGNP